MYRPPTLKYAMFSTRGRGFIRQNEKGSDNLMGNIKMHNYSIQNCPKKVTHTVCKKVFKNKFYSF
jgi:hypothetical protein